MKTTIPALFLLSFAVACGGSSTPAGTPAATQAPASQPAAGADAADPHAGHDMDKAGGMAFQALEGATVSFTMPADGDTVTSPVKVAFAVEGAKVHPAGEVISGTGHHHVIVDGEPTPAGTAVPADETHIHYGKGQTEAELDLAPGEHTLTLQFADGMHRSYGPEVSQTITVTVAEGEAAE